MNNTIPFVVTHPGELIRDEMRERGLKQRRLASLAGLTPRLRVLSHKFGWACMMLFSIDPDYFEELNKQYT